MAMAMAGDLQVSVEELAEIFKGALSWSELEQVCARRVTVGWGLGAGGRKGLKGPKRVGVGVTDFSRIFFFLFSFAFFRGV